MSEKKSWDIQRKPVAPRVEAPAAPVRREAPPRIQKTRKPFLRFGTPKPKRTSRPAPITEADDESGAVRPTKRVRMPSESLKARRKSQRRVVQIISIIILIAAIAGSIYGVWQPSVRISDIAVSGPNTEGTKQTAQSVLTGTYFGIIPRNSIFFIPTSAIRARVLAAYPDVDALSVTRTSFDSILLTTTPRVSAFVWCGPSINAQLQQGCFNADAQGFLFAPAAGTEIVESDNIASTSSSTPATLAPPPSAIGGMLRVFAPVDATSTAPDFPLRAHVESATRISDTLRFVKAIKALGIPVFALSIHDNDEADLWVSSATRITYVLGHEAQVVSLANAALPTLTLTDGSIEYVDLRFGERVYVKRYGSVSSTLQ